MKDKNRWSNLTDLTDQGKPKCQGLHRGTAFSSKLTQARRPLKRPGVGETGALRTRLGCRVQAELAGGVYRSSGFLGALQLLPLPPLCLTVDRIESEKPWFWHARYREKTLHPNKCHSGVGR